MADHSFHREERLKSRKEIQRLFKEGHSFVQFPLRFVWIEVEIARGESPAQFTMSAPKRRFRRAVQRNRLRRQMREAYRLHKHELYDMLGQGPQIACMTLYIAPQPLPFNEIERAMRQSLRRIGKTFHKKNTPHNAEDPS